MTGARYNTMFMPAYHFTNTPPQTVTSPNFVAGGQ
jgi:hypothetical protein